jgi:hypothetical protein
MRTLLAASLLSFGGVSPALGHTVTDYYPQSGGPGGTVTVHVSDMSMMKAPETPEALRLFINDQPLSDSKPTVDAVNGRVIFTLISSEATRSIWWALRNGERVVLSAGWNQPLAVTAPPLTDEDRRDQQRKFRIETEAAVTDFYPNESGIGSGITVHVAALRSMKAPNAAENLKLYLNGRLVPDSKPREIELRNGRVTFDLAYTDASKDAWHSALGWRPVEVSVGWDKEGALPVTATDQAGKPRRLRLVSGWRLMFFLVLFVGLVLAFGRAAKTTNLLRTRALSGSAKGDPPYAFSLGRCQMAWWTFIAMGAALFIWLLTGRFLMTDQVLVLMGISASTALGAVIVDASKQAGAAAEAARAATDVAQAQNAAATVQASLLAAPSAPMMASAQQAQLAVTTQESRLAGLIAEASPPRSRNGFLKDILSDENGISFHRFQIAGWTLVLGLYFVFEVAAKFEMPELPTELLVLMGISGTTYLGFKFPERRG